jgi:hypothetical protein
MNIPVKKPVSALLALIILAGFVIFTPQTAHASNQSSISRYTTASLVTSDGSSYSVQLSFTRPAPVFESDTVRAVNMLNYIDSNFMYMPMWRNATLGQTTANYAINAQTGPNPAFRIGQLGENQFRYTPVPDGGAVPTDLLSFTFTPPPSNPPRGMIYFMRVIPIHRHDFFGTTTQQQTWVSPSPNDTEAREIGLLTDMHVSAAAGFEGGRRYIEVTWSDLGMRDLVPFYEITWKNTNETVWMPPRVIRASDASADPVSGTLTTRIFDNSLAPMVFYHAKVEPVMADGRTLLRSGSPVVDANNIRYENFLYTPITRKEFISPAVMLQYLVTIRETEPELLTVEWELDQIPDMAPIYLTLFRADVDPVTGSPIMDSAISLMRVYGNDVFDITRYVDDRPLTPVAYWFTMIWESETIRLPSGAWERYTVESLPEFYFPGERVFDPYKPTVLQTTAIPPVPPSPPETPMTAISLVWEAFWREAQIAADFRAPFYDAASGKFTDTNIVYDIWVTDDVSAFADPNFTYEPVARFNLSNGVPNTIRLLENYNLTNGDIIPRAWTANISQYYSRAADGSYQRVTVEPLGNKIYYVHVRATRVMQTPANNNKFSADAYSSLFVPGRGDITTRPLMMNKPPLALHRLPNGSENITIDSVMITWRDRWGEVFDNTRKTWFSEIGVNNVGSFVFGTDISRELRDLGRTLDLSKVFNSNNFTEAQLKAAIGDFLDKLDAPVPSQDDLAILPVRVVDISGTQPRIHVASKEVVDAEPRYETADGRLLNEGYDSYVARLLENDGNQAALRNVWTQVSNQNPDSRSPDRLFRVTGVHAPQGRMQPNTPYIVIFRPFVNLPNGDLYAWLPNYVVGTTLAEDHPPFIIPTVPIIKSVGSTDTSITVRFTYDPLYKYGLTWVEMLYEYPAVTVRPPEGERVMWEGDLEFGKVVTERDERGRVTQWWEYTLEGLFPETTYYIGAYAYANDDKFNQSSMSWSNPCSDRTKELLPPIAPRGLGLASTGSLAYINRETGQRLVPANFDYLILEWMIDEKDAALPAANATFTGGSGNILTHEQIISTYLAQFTGLIGNKTYYVRAKTRLTLTKGTYPQASEPFYQYIVEISLRPDFLDSILLTVPPGEPVASATVLVKESPWTTVYRFMTTYTGDEYDGDKNDKMYPLPDDDFEITYLPDTQVLILRGRGAERADNLVDQRFISKLVREGVYNYVLDMSAYFDDEAEAFKPVKSRAVQLPYTMLRALEERKINLILIAGPMMVTLPPGFHRTSAFEGLRDVGVNSHLTIEMNTVFKTPELARRASYVTEPQNMSIAFETPSRKINITSTATAFDMSLKLADRYVTYDSNVDAYQIRESEWQRVPNTSYDRASGSMNFQTRNVSAWSVQSIEPPTSTSRNDPDTDFALAGVSTLLNIQDVNFIFPASEVSANQLNKILAAVATDSKDVRINAPVTRDERERLQRAGMYADPTGSATASGGLNEGFVSREAAIDLIVKLYELKTKRRVTGFPTAANSGLRDLGSVNPAYLTNVLKARHLGFIEGNRVDPKDNITMASMLMMLDMVIIDAGL